MNNIARTWVSFLGLATAFGSMVPLMRGVSICSQRYYEDQLFAHEVGPCMMFLALMQLACGLLMVQPDRTTRGVVCVTGSFSIAGVAWLAVQHPHYSLLPSWLFAGRTPLPDGWFALVGTACGWLLVLVLVLAATPPQFLRSANPSPALPLAPSPESAPPRTSV